MIIGTTFSHRHARHFQLDPEKAFLELVDLNFDSIRLACYWEEIETSPGVYDFTEIKRLLKIAEKRKQKIVLILGMKGPRFPEFFFPLWLKDRTPEGAEEYMYPFLEKTVKTLRNYSCITHWQVENEPLFRSGRIHRSIPLTILTKEIEVVRLHDARPIVVTLWGNDYQTHKLASVVEPLADVVGLDLYYKVPLLGFLYRGPWHSAKRFKRLIGTANKPYWITELQAEPWERRYFFKRAEGTPSLTPDLLKKNVSRAIQLEAEGIFLWGSEYWLMKKARGDLLLWNTVQEVLSSMR